MSKGTNKGAGSERSAEKVIAWNDSEPSGATGWIVIDCLINGVSGGGLFMHEHATEQEVTDLARSMTLKNGLQSPQFGGGKGGIRFDPRHPDAPGVLRRFLVDNKECIEHEWCTGADLNTSNEVIHRIIQDDLGLQSGFHCLGNMLHTRFGIENQSKKMLDRIKEKMNPIFPLSESATGYTVAKCIQMLAPKEIRIVIQGFGAVGKSLAYFAQLKGLGKIVGITEVDGFIYNEAGIDVMGLFAQKGDASVMGARLADFLDETARQTCHWTARNEGESGEAYLVRFLGSVRADVFCPCAARYQVTGKVLHTLRSDTFRDSPMPFIIGGANNIYDHPETFSMVEQSGIATIPEWVSNCGNALLFMESLKSQDNGPQWVETFVREIESRIENLFAAVDPPGNALTIHQKCYRQVQAKVDLALSQHYNVFQHYNFFSDHAHEPVALATQPH